MMQVSVLGIVAIGQTIVMIAKGFDLSVGVVVSLAGIVTVYLQPYGLVVAIVAGILVGVVVGMINGFAITKLNINPLIATLGSMTFVGGITLGVTNQNPVSGTDMNFLMLSGNILNWVPLPFLFLMGFLFLTDRFLKNYRLGRDIFAIGGNSDAAEYSGIKTDRVRFLSYVLCSTLAAIGGILLASLLNTGSPIAGNGMELATIAAVVLGGTKLTGGAGSVWGTFWGISILNILSNLLDLTGVMSYYQTGLQGLVLILVVIITTISAKRQKNKGGMLRTFQ
ncbi:ABC transporter permease [Cytobacillus purgationiresistens]|uniref:ABC transporter permease n=1 Tax=Cytobacillus purgationiresistens TaxID=863449 RepID=UPI0027D92363|nr:ABC transporter permease [Cytobacillus purgationiresistens]